MIDNVLKYTASEVNKYMVRKTDPSLDPSITHWVELGNVVKLQDNDGGEDNHLAGKMVLSLINIEEDKVSRPPVSFIRSDETIQIKNPKVYLNLYCLFASANKDYEKALAQLSLVIRFFQFYPVITRQSNPSDNPKLDPRVEKLAFDLMTLNFEQMNQLWGTLGGKYLPSVLYKMRLIAIEDETPKAEVKPILKIRITDSPTTN